MAPALLWQWPVDRAFLLWSAIVLGAAALLRRRLGARLPAAAPNLAAAVLFALLVGFFARRRIVALPTLLHEAELPAWVDYFIHGATIVSLGGRFAAGVGDIMLPGTPRVFYHYAPFTLPATLSHISGLCGVGLATAVLLPLGLMIGLLGLYCLARQWVGFWPSVTAVSLVAILPDASIVLGGNGFFGFQWLLFAAPGSGYAIGLAAVAYACLVRWFDEQRLETLALASLLTLLLILVRAHMFLLAAPGFAGGVVLRLVGPRWRTPLVVAITLVATVMTLLLAHGVGFGGYTAQYAKPFAYIVLSLGFGPLPYLEAIQRTANDWGNAAAALPAAALLLLATLGVWTAIFPVLFSWLAWRRKLVAADGVPAFLCCAYVLLIFWAPAAQSGDLGEYKHRHFVLLYAIIVLWTLLRLGRLSQDIAWRSKAYAACAAALGPAVLVFLLVAERNVDPARPLESLEWASSFYDVHIDPGIAQAADFIRARKRQGDMIAVDTVSAQSSELGPASELSSLTDMPIYVGRAELEGQREPQVAHLVEARLGDVRSVETSRTGPEAFDILRAHGIRWYVTLAPQLPVWDRDHHATTYKSGSVSVYETASP
jgi:hypothetical protein